MAFFAKLQPSPPQLIQKNRLQPPLSAGHLGVEGRICTKGLGAEGSGVLVCRVRG